MKLHCSDGSWRNSTAAIMSVTSAQSAAVNDCPTATGAPVEPGQRLPDQVLAGLLERVGVVDEVGRRHLVDGLGPPVQVRGLHHADRGDGLAVEGAAVDEQRVPVVRDAGVRGTPPPSDVSQWYSTSETLPGSPMQVGVHMSRIAPPNAVESSPISQRYESWPVAGSAVRRIVDVHRLAAGEVALMRFPFGSEMQADGIVIVGSAPAIPHGAVPVLFATMTPTAPAFWAFFTLTAKPHAAVDQRDVPAHGRAVRERHQPFVGDVSPGSCRRRRVRARRRRSSRRREQRAEAAPPAAHTRCCGLLMITTGTGVVCVEQRPPSGRSRGCPSRRRSACPPSRPRCPSRTR